eukprot:6171885-Pleurochrysis_carterae.AAC.3
MLQCLGVQMRTRRVRRTCSWMSSTAASLCARTVGSSLGCPELDCAASCSLKCAAVALGRGCPKLGPQLRLW